LCRSYRSWRCDQGEKDVSALSGTLLCFSDARALPRRPSVGLSARAAQPLRRRTAITAPLWFIRYGSEDDLRAVFPLAALLARDPDPVVHKAVGIALKHAGGRDPDAVERFLDQHAADMPRAAVRAAVDKLSPAIRSRFVG
jgi:hypothetical protein